MLLIFLPGKSERVKEIDAVVIATLLRFGGRVLVVLGLRFVLFVKISSLLELNGFLFFRCLEPVILDSDFSLLSLSF